MKNIKYQHNKYLIILFLLSISTFSCQNTRLEKLIKEVKNSKQNEYILEKEKICDLNNDKKNDAILVYRSKNPDKEIETFDAPIVLIVSSNNDYVRKENPNIIYSFIPDNMVLDNNLVIKNNYFTIEQTTGGGNNKEKKYITFKFDIINKAIILHKYSIETIYPGKNGMLKKNQNFSTKDFGIIKFENITEDFFTKLNN